MAEREYEVRMVGVDYICDACDLGVMEPTDICLPVFPVKWRYKCGHCGGVADLPEKYPTVRCVRLPSY